MYYSRTALRKPAANCINRVSGLVFLVALSNLMPCSLSAAVIGFTGPYALNNFTLTNTNLNQLDTIAANGTASLALDSSLILTGSNTGSGLTPGALTSLTIASRGAGLVTFDWTYSTLDDPGFDSGGYFRMGQYNLLADSDLRSGSVSFQVQPGDIFGFGVRTFDNTGEPGILTLRNFTAPENVVPEPGTSSLILMPLTGAILIRLYARKRQSTCRRLDETL